MNKNTKRHIGFSFSAIALAVLGATQAYAAGFQISEQSIVNQGRAIAGAGVVGDDLSASFYNPAGLTLLDGSAVQFGVTYAELDAPFSGQNTDTANFIPGKPIVTKTSGSDNGRSQGEFIPNTYAMHRVNNQLVLGLGITTPFGLGAKYSDNWVGRDHGISSSIKTVDINPSIAYQLDEQWSIGGGISAQYAKANLRQGGFLPGASGQLKADSWGFGYNLGVMYKFSPDTRIGLSYRSKIEHDASGDYINSGFKEAADKLKAQGAKLVASGVLSPAAAQKALGIANSIAAFDGTYPGSATVTTPESILLSAYSQLTPKFGLSGSLRWTNWSRFDQLVVKGSPSDALRGPTVINNHWKPSWMASVGGDYKYNDQLTLRSGIAYETTPIRNTEYRNPLIPDTDRLWLSMGASYKIDKNLSVDASYTFLHSLGDTSINHFTTSPLGTSSHLQGEYKNITGHLVGVQMQYKF